MAMPKDSEDRRIGSKARALVHYQIDANHWLFREETGNDVGRDCSIELSEDNEWRNHKLEGQIKGTTVISNLKDEMISFPMPVKTIEYALGSSTSFVLFVADVNSEIVYYQCIQSYFITHRYLFDKLSQKTISIRIPKSQTISENDALLKSFALKTYIGGPGKGLKEY